MDLQIIIAELADQEKKDLWFYCKFNTRNKEKTN